MYVPALTLRGIRILTVCYSGFNQIDLPQYTSYEMLRQQLLLAILEGSEGFGFA
jgi:E3 ubiquitin-protein ligase HUWE1